MSFIDAFLGLSVSFLLGFPGVLMLFVIFPRRSIGEIFFVGFAAGWALVVLVTRFFPLSWFIYILGLVYIITLTALFRSLYDTKTENVARLKGSPFLWLLAVSPVGG